MWGSLKLFAEVLYLCAFFRIGTIGFIGFDQGYMIPKFPGPAASELARILEGVFPSPAIQLSHQDLQSNLPKLCLWVSQRWEHKIITKSSHASLNRERTWK